jgi:hypothetical protein
LRRSSTVLVRVGVSMRELRVKGRAEQGGERDGGHARRGNNRLPQ